MRSERERLLDILEAIERIEKYAEGEKDDFESDQLIQTWVVYHITVIGEACRALSDDFQATYANVPWADIFGMRNIHFTGNITTERKSMLDKKYKKIVFGLGLFFIVVCIVPLVYMTLFRWVDYAICIRSMAGKAGVSPSIDGIEGYIFETAIPGMEREEVLKVLEKLGPVDIRFQDTTYPPDNVRDTILINSCMHPLNDLRLYAIYNSEGKLISISLLNAID